MPDNLYQSLMQMFQQQPQAQSSLWEGLNNDPGMIESLSRAISGGRDRGQRTFYNETRAGLYNSAPAPDAGWTYGGIGSGLNLRRDLQKYDALNISRAVRPNLREE